MYAASFSFMWILGIRIQAFPFARQTVVYPRSCLPSASCSIPQITFGIYHFPPSLYTILLNQQYSSESCPPTNLNQSPLAFTLRGNTALASRAVPYVLVTFLLL